jgi:hypothetical protein
VICEVYGRSSALFKSTTSDLLGCKLKIILVTNAIDAHAQVIMKNGEMLLSFLKALPQFTPTLHATLNA